MAPSSVRSKLFTPMTRYIESQIASGALKPNDRLAPLRQWSEEFDINLDAARRGMWYLQGKGLVECRRGSGVYVRDFGKVRQNHAGSLQIGLVFATQDLERSYCAHALRGIRQQQGDKTELRDIAIPYSRGEASAEFRKCVDEVNAQQSIIMLGNYDRNNCDFSWLHIPAVGVEMHRMHGGLFSVVSMDPVNAAELAADYFLKHGKKAVRVYVDTTPLHLFRAQVFQAIFAGIPRPAPIPGSACDAGRVWLPFYRRRKFPTAGDPLAGGSGARKVCDHAGCQIGTFAGLPACNHHRAGLAAGGHPCPGGSRTQSCQSRLYGKAYLCKCKFG